MKFLITILLYVCFWLLHGLLYVSRYPNNLWIDLAGGVLVALFGIVYHEMCDNDII